MAIDEEGNEDEEDDKFLTPKWHLNVIQSAIRLILNIFAGGMIAKGYGDRESWGHVMVVSVILGTLGWAIYNQWNKRKRNANTDDTYE